MRKINSTLTNIYMFVTVDGVKKILVVGSKYIT